MIPPALVSAIVIAAFAVFGVAAQVARARAIAQRGPSIRRAGGI